MARPRDVPFGPPKGEADRWRWLWQQIEWDHEGFCEMAGVTEETGVTVITKLMGHRLIFPDGTVSPMALQFLRMWTSRAVRSEK